ncbi:oxidoreductase [Klebsiella pneumoniae]|nr:oxidoreductase [Klebsiella pneumoniae]
MVSSEVYCGALKHMGGGQIHSLNMLLGSAQAAHSLGVKIFESSPVVEVNYGKQVRVRTAMGSVKAAKLLWACDSFLNNMEPEIYNKTLVTYSYQVSTEPLSDELIERISPLRGAFSDIRPVINYYRVTRENRLPVRQRHPLCGVYAERFRRLEPHLAGGGLPLSQGCEDRFCVGRADGL